MKRLFALTCLSIIGLSQAATAAQETYGVPAPVFEKVELRCDVLRGKNGPILGVTSPIIVSKNGWLFVKTGVLYPGAEPSYTPLHVVSEETGKHAVKQVYESVAGLWRLTVVTSIEGAVLKAQIAQDNLTAPCEPPQK